MSTSAGRVLIIPQGEYDSETTYNMLDVVYDQNGSFICKKTSTGNAPDAEQDTEYWQRLAIPSNDVGDLSTLNTTAKSSAVAAINEVNANIGDLDDLDTTADTSAVAAINEVYKMAEPVEITFSNVSSLPQTKNNAEITAAMKCKPGDVYCSSSSAYLNATVTTSNGSVTISGTLSGTTDITIWLTTPRTLA